MDIKPLIDNTEKKREYLPLKITLRDKGHLYTVIDYLNKEVGRGPQFWCCNDRPMKKLANSNGEPVEVIFRVYTENKEVLEGFDAGEAALFMKLAGSKTFNK